MNLTPCLVAGATARSARWPGIKTAKQKDLSGHTENLKTCYVSEDVAFFFDVSEHRRNLCWWCQTCLLSLLMICEYFLSHLRFGSVSKPCTPVVHIKIAGKWMFIPLKMVCIGIDPYPFKQTMVPHQSTSEATANPLLATERNGLEPPSPVPSGANGVNTEVKSLTSHTCGKRSDDD